MRRRIAAVVLASSFLVAAAHGQAARKGRPEPLMIQEQGSFAAGGKVITNPGTFNPRNPTPEGQTLHGDHAYVFYQIPVNPRKFPLVFLHGAGPDARKARLDVMELATESGRRADPQ